MPMTEQQRKAIEQQVIQAGRTAYRELVPALQQEVTRIMSQEEDLTPEGRRKRVGQLLPEQRFSIQVGLSEDAQSVIERAREQVERDLGKLKAVEPEEVAARAAVLGPILNTAATEPEQLVNLYRKRHKDPVDRHIIEEAAAAKIDAGGEDVTQFHNQWSAALEEAAVGRSPEEAEAISHQEALDELQGYLNNVITLVNTDLALMDPEFSGDRDSLAVSRPMAEAEVNRYESEHAGEMATA